MLSLSAWPSFLFKLASIPLCVVQATKAGALFIVSICTVQNERTFKVYFCELFPSNKNYSTQLTVQLNTKTTLYTPNIIIETRKNRTGWNDDFFAISFFLSFDLMTKAMMKDSVAVFSFVFFSLSAGRYSVVGLLLRSRCTFIISFQFSKHGWQKLFQKHNVVSKATFNKLFISSGCTYVV